MSRSATSGESVAALVLKEEKIPVEICLKTIPTKTANNLMGWGTRTRNRVCYIPLILTQPV